MMISEMFTFLRLSQDLFSYPSSEKDEFEAHRLLGSYDYEPLAPSTFSLAAQDLCGVSQNRYFLRVP